MIFAYFGTEWTYLVLFTVFGIPLLLVILLWILQRTGFLPRRHRPGHCSKCDYDLTGNVSGRCPECGTKVERPPATWSGRIIGV